MDVFLFQGGPIKLAVEQHHQTVMSFYFILNISPLVPITSRPLLGEMWETHTTSAEADDCSSFGPLFCASR